MEITPLDLLHEFFRIISILDPLDLWMAGRSWSFIPALQEAKFIIFNWQAISEFQQSWTGEGLRVTENAARKGLLLQRALCSAGSPDEAGIFQNVYFFMQIYLVTTSPVRHGNDISTGNSTFSLSKRERWSCERHIPKGSGSWGRGVGMCVCGRFSLFIWLWIFQT